MRDELLKSLSKIVAIIAVVMALFLSVYYYNAGTHITGKIVGKNVTGYGDKMHYMTISDNERMVKIKVSSGQYNRYDLMENVYVDYTMLKEAVSISDAK